ncbi:MAG: divalent-cation tolerance protein CutA [Pyrinomonadaceae bacterium]|jgi:periplasmic divalent cation tolerance protein|nr:divalent-cation tolerance protein CutA [Pyrinomonadaceae bacterium]
MNEANGKAVVVMMTASSREEAARLAEMLVGAQLAACVQIMPAMQSVYRWKGKIQREPEFLLLAKTTQERFAELEREVRALHSYETPEIVALPVSAASAPYLEWLTSTVKPQRRAQPSVRAAVAGAHSIKESSK